MRFGRAREERTGSMVAERIEGFADGWLGLDSLTAHRLMILPHEHQMLFTYNGGSIFTASSMEEALSEPKPEPRAGASTAPTQR